MAGGPGGAPQRTDPVAGADRRGESPEARVGLEAPEKLAVRRRASPVARRDRHRPGRPRRPASRATHRPVRPVRTPAARRPARRGPARPAGAPDPPAAPARSSRRDRARNADLAAQEQPATGSLSLQPCQPLQGRRSPAGLGRGREETEKAELPARHHFGDPPAARRRRRAGAGRRTDARTRRTPPPRGGTTSDSRPTPGPTPPPAPPPGPLRSARPEPAQAPGRPAGTGRISFGRSRRRPPPIDVTHDVVDRVEEAVILLLV